MFFSKLQPNDNFALVVFNQTSQIIINLSKKDDIEI